MSWLDKIFKTCLLIIVNNANLENIFAGLFLDSLNEWTLSPFFLDSLNKWTLSPFSLVYYYSWGPSRTVIPFGFKFLLPLLMIIFLKLDLVDEESKRFFLYFNFFPMKLKHNLVYLYVLFVVTMLVNICLTNYSSS